MKNIQRNLNIYLISKYNIVIILLVLCNPLSINNYNIYNSNLKNLNLKETKLKDSNDFNKNYSLNRLLKSSYEDILEEDYKPIRIHVDYSNFSIPVLSNSDKTLLLNKVKNVMKDTIKVFESILSVKRIKNKLKIDNCPVEGITIPKYIIDDGQENSDLIIFVTYDSNTRKLLEAWAAPCFLSKYNNRPIGGVIGLSKLFLNDLKTSNFKTNWELYSTYTLLHEITHILVFNKSLYSFFWDENLKKQIDINDVLATNVKVNNEPRNMIITKKVVDKAKKHFNCDNITGVELENQGGDGAVGSHWESRLMLGDYMTAATYEDVAISDITLALFEDSGWYQVKYYSGGLFKFGKNSGCSFINEKCIANKKENNKLLVNNANSFCIEDDQPKCTPGNKYKGYCSISENYVIKNKNFMYFENGNTGGYFFADYCPVARGYAYSDYYYGGSCAYGKPGILPEQMLEEISETSGCFQSNLVNTLNMSINRQSICYKYVCNHDKKRVEIFLKDKTTINCDTEGGIKTLPNFTGELECPKYDVYCNSTIQCFNIIDCINKKSKTIYSDYFKTIKEDDSLVIEQTSLNSNLNNNNFNIQNNTYQNTLKLANLTIDEIYDIEMPKDNYTYKNSTNIELNSIEYINNKELATKFVNVSLILLSIVYVVAVL